MSGADWEPRPETVERWQAEALAEALAEVVRSRAREPRQARWDRESMRRAMTPSLADELAASGFWDRFSS